MSLKLNLVSSLLCLADLKLENVLIDPDGYPVVRAVVPTLRRRFDPSRRVLILRIISLCNTDY